MEFKTSIIQQRSLFHACPHYLNALSPMPVAYEPRSEKTGLRGFRPGPTQTGLYSHKRRLEA